MRKALTAMSAAAFSVVAFSVRALETNISNEFWCTWNRINAVPSPKESVAADFDSRVETERASAAEDFDSRFLSTKYSDVLQHFDSNPCGTFIFLR